jgi:hypothetical protein
LGSSAWLQTASLCAHGESRTACKGSARAAEGPAGYYCEGTGERRLSGPDHRARAAWTVAVMGRAGYLTGRLTGRLTGYLTLYRRCICTV